MSTFDPSQPPLVSETLLKKRRSLDELIYKRSVTVKTQQKRKRVRGEVIKIKRPEQFVREFRIKEGSQHKMQRRKNTVERRATVDVPKGSIKPTVGFAVRIHEGRHASAEIKLELRKLGLYKKYDAVFIRLDDASIAKLKPLDAYVAYGYITNKSVHELVHRRSFVSIGNGDPQPLSDNNIVEQLLGGQDILCLNDLCHELFCVGPNFDAAKKIFRTFKLSSPVGHFEKTILDVHDKVEEKGGFLGDAMEDFLNKIL